MKTGQLGREASYKALALIALAQQGKQVSEKGLESLVDTGDYGFSKLFRKIFVRTLAVYCD